MRWTVARLILFRVLPGRLLPILTVVEVVRLVRQVRRLRRGAR
jgi:hypothetical protein